MYLFIYLSLFIYIHIYKMCNKMYIFTDIDIEVVSWLKKQAVGCSVR